MSVLEGYAKEAYYYSIDEISPDQNKPSEHIVGQAALYWQYTVAPTTKTSACCTLQQAGTNWHLPQLDIPARLNIFPY